MVESVDFSDGSRLLCCVSFVFFPVTQITGGCKAPQRSIRFDINGCRRKLIGRYRKYLISILVRRGRKESEKGESASKIV